MKKLCMFAILLAMLCGPVYGAVYYVSPSGSNNNTGTVPESVGSPGEDSQFPGPWKTLKYAASRVRAGDTVYVRSGTYVEDGVIRPVASGTESSWIVFEKYPRDEEEAVVETPSGSFFFGWGKGNYVLVKGLTFVGKNPIEITSSFVTIRECQFRDTEELTIKLWGADHATIAGNTFTNCSGSRFTVSTDIAVLGNEYYNSGLTQFSTGSRRCLVQGNYVKKSRNVAFAAVNTNPDTITEDISFINNVIMDVTPLEERGNLDGTGIGIECDLAPCRNFKIIQNFFTHRSPAIWLTGPKDEAGVAELQDIIIEGNILVDNHFGIMSNRNVTRVTIEGNSITGCLGSERRGENLQEGRAIWFFHATTDSEIIDNWIALNPVGVGIPNDSRGQSTGNSIVGNYLYNGRNLGIGSRVKESTYIADNVMVLRVRDVLDFL